MANERRLIDSEGAVTMLKKAAVHMLNGYPDSYDTGVSKGLIDAADIIAHAPTVDAVEVVRCRDCKHHRVFRGRDMCARNAKLLDGHEVGLRATGADDFCSYGERKEG